MSYDTVPAVDSDSGDTDTTETINVKRLNWAIEVEGLNWVVDELKVYPASVVPDEEGDHGYYLTGAVLEDNPREISIGGLDASNHKDKNDVLGDCCLWITSRKFRAISGLEEFVVDEWDGGNR